MLATLGNPQAVVVGVPFSRTRRGVHGFALPSHDGRSRSAMSMIATVIVRMNPLAVLGAANMSHHYRVRNARQLTGKAHDRHTKSHRDERAASAEGSRWSDDEREHRLSAVSLNRHQRKLRRPALS